MRDIPAQMKRREFLRKAARAAAYLGLTIPIIGSSQSCKQGSPAAPEEPKVLFQYRTVEVTYTRNIDKIKRPTAETRPVLYYTLYDADPQAKHLDEMAIEDWIQGGYRQGFKRMNEFDENVYKCTLQNVFVQTEEFNEPHSSYVQDGKFWVPPKTETTYTSDGLVIPGAVVVGFCKAGYTMYWRMSVS